LARREQAARRVRQKERRRRLQGDRRKAGSLLLPDRRAAARGFEPVSTSPRKDRAVQKGPRRPRPPPWAHRAEAVPGSPGRERRLAPNCRRNKAARASSRCRRPHSHSIVAGGFELTSYTTRFTPRT